MSGPEPVTLPTTDMPRMMLPLADGALVEIAHMPDGDVRLAVRSSTECVAVARIPAASALVLAAFLRVTS